MFAPYLEAARSALDLVTSGEVASRWDEASALAGMDVAALAAHLGSQLVLVRDTLHDRAFWSHESPVPLLDHYRRSAWVTASLDDDANVMIRAGADELAAPGHGAVVARVRLAWDELGAVDAGTVPAVVRMPWWQWSLSFDDFLVTRMMEIVVHSDDLAVSLDVDPPVLAATVLEPVLSLLTGVAVMRHGQAAVVRALSRSERAPGTISAF